jgi:hypothetical protein
MPHDEQAQCRMASNSRPLKFRSVLRKAVRLQRAAVRIVWSWPDDLSGYGQSADASDSKRVRLRGIMSVETLAWRLLIAPAAQAIAD